MNIKRCSEEEKQCGLNTNMYTKLKGGGGLPQLRKKRERKVSTHFFTPHYMGEKRIPPGRT